MSQKVHENGKQDGNAQNIPCQVTEDLHGKDSPSKNEHRMNESGRWALKHVACARNWFSKLLEFDPSAFSRH